MFLSRCLILVDIVDFIFARLSLGEKVSIAARRLNELLCLNSFLCIIINQELHIHSRPAGSSYWRRYSTGNSRRLPFHPLRTNLMILPPEQININLYHNIRWWWVILVQLSYSNSTSKRTTATLTALFNLYQSKVRGNRGKKGRK